MTDHDSDFRMRRQSVGLPRSVLPQKGPARNDKSQCVELVEFIEFVGFMGIATSFTL
jgi:hypothetical protein